MFEPLAGPYARSLQSQVAGRTIVAADREDGLIVDYFGVSELLGFGRALVIWRSGVSYI